MEKILKSSNKISRYIRKLTRITLSEIRAQFTPVRFVMIFVIFALPLIASFATGKLMAPADENLFGWAISHKDSLLDYQDQIENLPIIAGETEPVLPDGLMKIIKEAWIKVETWNIIGRLFSEGIIYSLGFRMFLVLRDKSTLDKNRASYLKYSSGKVLFAKTLADSLQFLISLLLISVIGVAIVINYNKGVVVDGFYQHAALYVFAMFMFYIFITVIMRLIQYTISDKVIRVISLTLFVILTIGTYLVMSIVTGVVMVDGRLVVKNYIVDHQTIFAFIPFVNIVLMPLLLYDAVDMWTLVPIITYSLIVVIMVWWKLSRTTKEFLCA